MVLKIFVFVEGVNAQQFESTYGIQTDGSGSLDLRFVTHGEYSDNVGSRVYLTDPSGDKYYMFRYSSPLLPCNTSTLSTFCSDSRTRSSPSTWTCRSCRVA